MKIQFNDLGSQWKKIKKNTLPKILKTLKNGSYILGPEVNEFEKNFSEWNGNKFTIGVANGTDALKISISSLELKGKTIFYIPSNTYIATALSTYFSLVNNFDIKFIDCDEFLQINVNLLENSIIENLENYNNHVIIPVHLYGSSCDILKIMELSEKYKTYVIEDCSQAHGALGENGKKVGNYGHISAFSCYPGKNLGAAGDAGIIVTNDEILYKRCLYLRNLGSVVKYEHEVMGWNSRLDTIQSIILNEKLKFLNEWNDKRIDIANFFVKNIKNEKIKIINKAPYCEKHVYHIFCIMVEDRDNFQKFLNEKDIPNLIHYPIPIEKTKIFMNKKSKNDYTNFASEKILSLPIHPFMDKKQMRYIVNTVNSF
jgi:dTDP-4-amino-4,6-dideoxygalactose transaminase